MKFFKYGPLSIHVVSDAYTQWILYEFINIFNRIPDKPHKACSLSQDDSEAIKLCYEIL